MIDHSLLRLDASLKGKVWGGDRLKGLKGISVFDESEGKLGETWEVSCHKDGPSLFQGQSIGDLIDEAKLPYLVKFIDTTDNLSIQVHPDDDYAKRYENSKGKTECWLILSSDEGAGIYLGLKPGVSKKDLESSLNRKDDLNHLLNFYPVKRGDFFYVPAGTIHAIGNGVTLAEVQQSSGITYRVWDWNRLGVDGKARELHIEKSLDVINFAPECNTKDYFCYQEFDKPSLKSLNLIKHDDFCIDIVNSEHYEVNKGEDDRRYHSLLVLEGEVDVLIGGKSYSLKGYDAGLVIKNETFEVISNSSKAKYLHIY